MPVYYGVVKDNMVALPEGAHLDDGTRVEIRSLAPGDPVSNQPPESTLELKRRLVEAGLLEDIRPASTVAVQTDVDRSPAVVRGKPMSQLVIEDRR